MNRRPDSSRKCGPESRVFRWCRDGCEADAAAEQPPQGGHCPPRGASARHGRMDPTSPRCALLIWCSTPSRTVTLRAPPGRNLAAPRPFRLRSVSSDTSSVGNDSELDSLRSDGMHKSLSSQSLDEMDDVNTSWVGGKGTWCIYIGGALGLWSAVRKVSSPPSVSRTACCVPCRLPASACSAGIVACRMLLHCVNIQDQTGVPSLAPARPPHVWLPAVPPRAPPPSQQLLSD
jgi:hypothetical protein